MKIPKPILISIMALIACNSSNKDKNPSKITPGTTVEKFDTTIYAKTGKGFRSYLKEDGFEIYEMDFDASGGVQKERFPKPQYYTLYKEFYPNGSLKMKQKRMGEFVTVGISEYYDASGKLLKKVDEDKKFGKIGPEELLRLLEGKKIINLTTGNGTGNMEGHQAFELHFNTTGERKTWLVIVNSTKSNEPPLDSIGEPLERLPTTYKVDGETGEEMIDIKL